MKKILWMAVGVFLLVSRAWALDTFVIDDIRVEGLQRISAGTVFNYLPVKVGDTLTQDQAAEAIRALFATGFFKDVRLEREGGVLVVIVDERPAVSEIKVTGNKDIDSKELLESLKNIGLAEGRVFDRSLLDKVEQELQRQYFSTGKYAVKIETTVTPLERNRVGIHIAISEGKAARIRQINIVGNQSFPDKELIEDFQSSGPTWFSFLTNTDQYSKQKLSADLETLRSFYLDRGYINFNVESTQVSITPDKRDIYVTINITEGEQYRVKEIRLAGDLVVSAETLTPLITLQNGEVFSRKTATESATAIGERLGNDGYAFANVNTIPDVQEDSKEVVVTFFIDPGKRVYVRRINMVGNINTRDEVMRREMRQMEGGWFSTAAVNRSRVRLQKLGFFDEVNVETPAVPGTTDQVDVNYTVVERAAGNLTVGLGYSQGDGFLFNTSVTQDNFLGSGNRVALAFNNSQVNTVYSFSYLNPYYTIDGISRGFGMYYKETDADEADLIDYSTDTFGGNINFGIPINEYDTIRVSLGYENLNIDEGTLPSATVNQFITDNGDQFDTVKLTTGWSRDTRNKFIFADEGMLQSLSGEVTVPGLDLEYYKINYRQLLYVPVTKKVTLSLNGEVGYGDAYGDLTELPFFENFYAGGPRTVRGFQDNTLGPRDPLTGDPIGGNLKVVGNAELILPVPFVKEIKSFRWTAFVDVGNVYQSTDFDAGDLRYSTGVAALWMSPLGPLTFSLAQPLNDKKGDDTQMFQFSIGTGF